MKKVLILLSTVLLLTLLTLAVGAADVVYLKNGGAGDGSSASSPVGSLEDAFAKLDLSGDCTVVLCGEFTQSATFLHTKKYDGTVTFTSVYDGVDYRKTAGAVYTPGPTRYVLTGATVFEDMDFYLQADYFLVIAAHNPLTIGEGVTMQSASKGFNGKAIASGFSILGGYQNGVEVTKKGATPPTVSDEPVNITIKSGKNIVLVAYSRQIKEPAYSGKATITVEGDAHVGMLYFAPVNTTFGGNADVEIHVGGNAYIEKLVGGTNDGTLNSVTLHWESGEIGYFARSTREAVTTTAANGYTLLYGEKAEQAAFFPTVSAKFDTMKATFTPSEEKPNTPTETPSEKPKDTDTPRADGYNVISVEDYMDKTTAAFLSKLISFSTDYKFVWNADGTPRVALPDHWFGWCKGSDTPNNPYHQKVAKLLFNEQTKMYDLYIADTFGIEILNLYILADMYEQFGTVTTKTITDGWVKYDVWDMGGGNRQQGAYALARGNRYIAPFLGMAEYGNRFPWCEEPWICNNTIGCMTAGMPNTAIDIAKIFGSVTGDSDNLVWVDFIAAMYAMAYFEDDIPTLIRDAADLFPDNSYQRYVVDLCFELYAKYPDNWRRAIVEAEQAVFRNCFYYHTDRSINEQGEADVNMAFSILALLYGKGDYEATGRIFSLSGYDARGVIFSPILGIIGGMDVIPKAGLDMIWQGGKGEIVNLPVIEETGWWMHHEGLPERMVLSDIMAMFQKNFESILLENGGKIENGYYYIPVSAYRVYDHIELDNFDFEGTDASGWSILGDKASVTVTDYSYLGNGALQIVGSETAENGIYKTVSGLTVGDTYKMTAYVIASVNATARLFARNVGEVACAHATVQAQPEFVRRELVFTATAETMEIGIKVDKLAKYGYATVDEITLLHIAENKVDGIGDVTVVGTQNADGAFTGKISFTVDGKCAKQVYLKLTFANQSGFILDGKVTVNGTSFNTVPFYKTGATYADGAVDCVYIPVLLTADKNTVTLDMGNDALLVREAKICTVTDRLNVHTDKTTVKLTIGAKTGYVNGTAKALDAAPIIRNARTMLPVRFVAEAFGAEVGWDGKTSTVTVKAAGTTIEIVIGKATAKVNGTEITLDSPAFIESNRTYLPVRFVAENLGATVLWDGATSTATLTK